jgi:hypothetical protein
MGCASDGFPPSALAKGDRQDAKNAKVGRGRQDFGRDRAPILTMRSALFLPVTGPDRLPWAVQGLPKRHPAKAVQGGTSRATAVFRDLQPINTQPQPDQGAVETHAARAKVITPGVQFWVRLSRRRCASAAPRRQFFSSYLGVLGALAVAFARGSGTRTVTSRTSSPRARPSSCGMPGRFAGRGSRAS